MQSNFKKISLFYILLKIFFQLLRPFKTSTIVLCTEKYSTVPLIYSMKMVPPQYLQHSDRDGEVIDAIKSVMSAYLITRYIF